jgi:hypothetical protein
VLTRPISVSGDVDVGGLPLGAVDPGAEGSGVVCADATDANTSKAATLIRGKSGRSCDIVAPHTE